VADDVAPELQDRYLLSVLKRPLHRRDRPTATHFTLEVAAYWADDFIDAVRSGLRRKLTVGGLRSAGKANLAVELAPPLRPYTIARIRGHEAVIAFPAAAALAVRREDGRLDPRPVVEPEGRAPFAARAYRLRFHESFAFRVGALTFLCRFVHRDGRPRHPLDWLPAAVFPGYMG
jgi:hypothetical protein